MIWGIEGLHAWTPPGEADPVLTLNQLDDDGDPVWPRYVVEGVGGLTSLGDIEETNDPKVGKDGENPRPSKRRGKTVTYSGVVQARSLRSLRLAEAALRAAFEDASAEGRVDITAHPDNLEFAADPPKHFFAKAMGVDGGDEQGPPTAKHFGYERPFVVALRMSDPHYFDDEGGEYA